MKSLKDANAPVVSKAMVLTNVKVVLDHRDCIYVTYCFMCCLCAHLL